jgi:DNA-directed RNA polymerase specialized sigma24 family protein
LNWLDGGLDSDGRAYVGMRRRLTDYFRRKNCLIADDLADETLTRVARRLEEEGIALTDTPARYCYIVARFVFLEYLRDNKSRQTVADPSTIIARTPAAPPADAAAAGGTEQRLASLEKCLQELDALKAERFPGSRLIVVCA